MFSFCLGVGITLIGRGVNGVCDLPDRLDFGTVARDEMYQMSFEIKNPTDLPADAQIGEIYSSSGDDARTRLAKLQAQRLEELNRGRAGATRPTGRPNKPEQRWSNRTLIALATSAPSWCC